MLNLTGRPYKTAAIVVFLGLASSIFEGIGLSFLIPLIAFESSAQASYDIPVIGRLIGFLDGWLGLNFSNVAVLVVGFFLLGIAITYLNIVVSTIVTMKIAHDLRSRIFETTLTRPMSEIESTASGKFFNDLATETWQVCDAFFLMLGMLLQTIAFLVLLGFLVIISPFYTLILLGTTGAMAITIHFVTKPIRDLGQAGVSANEAFMAYIWDTLAGLRIIRGFGSEAYERARFETRSIQISNVFKRIRILSGIVDPLTRMMSVGMIALIVSVAVIRGDSLAFLIGFLAIAYRMQPRVSNLLGSRTELRSLEASVRSIEEALALKGSLYQGKKEFVGLRDSIVFESVTASYPNAEKPSLHEVSCTFPHGKVVAIAGYSGAGKSTMVALLLRFLEQERGRILVDGTPLSDISPESWHRRIAFVEQNSFLFNASVRDNIGYSDSEADFDAIREAARLAEAEDFIEDLPKGYDTPIGDEGFRLSQGQRQRIALARALLRNPDVLILDEATNALDRPTDEALRLGIEKAGRVGVVIVIAHRRETIENAEHVIVIDQGRIIEAGTPEELARSGGVYSRLYIDQLDEIDPKPTIAPKQDQRRADGENGS